MEAPVKSPLQSWDYGGFVENPELYAEQPITLLGLEQGFISSKKIKPIQCHSPGK